MIFGFSASYIALWGLVLFQGLLVLAVLRQLAELQRLVAPGVPPDLSWLPVGIQAPEFTDQDLDSGHFVSTSLFKGRGGVVLFLSPDCSVCRALAESFRSTKLSSSALVIAVCSGKDQPCGNLKAAVGKGVRLLFDRANEIGARYHISSVPTAVVVDKDQRIRAYVRPQSFSDIERALELSKGDLVAQERASQPPFEIHPKSSVGQGDPYETQQVSQPVRTS